MFLEHFGLIEQPFGVTPDPRFLHLGRKHREALASLVYGTETNRGFLALIAEPGMGKTSLLYQYLEGLRGKARTAFLFQTDCDSRDFLRHILVDMGIDPSGRDTAQMHAMLNEELMREMRAGRRFILVIDEAQNLSEDTLESVRLLSNFETPWMKLMQIVIAGQPQLADRLTRPCLAQLRQRISSVIRIEPLTPDEINTYIDHRLWVAGYTGAPLFTVGARLKIAKHSGGIPRNINTICFNAMSVALGQGAKQVDAKMVDEAANDVEMESLVQTKARAARVVVAPSKPAALRLALPESSRRARPMTYAFAAFCVAMLFGTFTWIGWERGMHLDPIRTVASAARGVSSAAGAGVRSLESSVSELLQRGDGSGAESAVARQAQPDPAPESVESPTAAPTPAPIEPEAPDALSAAITTAPPAQPTLLSATLDDEPAAAPVAPTVAQVSSVPFTRRFVRSSVPAGFSNNDSVLVVAVSRDTRLREICLQYIGKDDRWTLAETYALNPTLHGAALIHAGERVELPLYLRDDFVAERTIAAQITTRAEREVKP
jgi:general secretion pathway protein A